MGEPYLYVCILGPIGLRVEGADVPVRRAKAQALLGFLAMHANRVVGIDRLVAALWDDPPPSARANLRNNLTDVRRLLDGGIGGADRRLVRAASGVRLRLEVAELDLLQYQEELRRGRACVVSRVLAPAAEHYRQALELWCGSVLEGTPRGTVLDDEVRRVEESRLDTLEEAAEVSLELGEHLLLIDQLRGVLAQHPYRERACACLMTALYRSENSAAALHLYQVMERRLRVELGIAPTPRLQKLQTAILRHDRAVLDGSKFHRSAAWRR